MEATTTTDPRHSPLPVTVEDTSAGYVFVRDAHGQRIAEFFEGPGCDVAKAEANARVYRNAVNSHDALVAEVAALTKERDDWKRCAESHYEVICKLRAELDAARAALEVGANATPSDIDTPDYDLDRAVEEEQTQDDTMLHVGDTVLWRGEHGHDAPVRATVKVLRIFRADERRGCRVNSVPWACCRAIEGLQLNEGVDHAIIATLDNGRWAYIQQLSPDNKETL